MSSAPHQHDAGTSETAESSAAQRLSDWRARLDRFGAAFDAEVSEILTTLSSLSFEEDDETLCVASHPPTASNRDTASSRDSVSKNHRASNNHAASTDRTDSTNRAVSNNDQTMEFTLPATPPAPLRSAPPKEAPPQIPAREAAAEPDRLAALKAKLAQQMATTGHPQATAVRPAEEAR
jgi:hypothetical protein